MAKRRSKGEGTIYRRKDGLWSAQLTLPTGKRKTKYAKTQKEAKQWLLEQRKQLYDGTLSDDKKITFGEFLDLWFKDVKAPLLRPSTYYTHESIIRNHIKPEIGSIRLSQVSPAILQTLYAKKLKSGLSKRTVKYIHTVIYQTLDQALKWDLVVRNVATAVDAPTPDKKPVEPLTQDQIKRLFDELENDRLFPLYLTMLGCGLRRGEALALQWECVDLDEGYILVKKTLQNIKDQGIVVSEPKSESSHRIVGMPDFVKKALQKHKENIVVESGFVFSTYKGTPFSPRNVVRHFKNTLKKAGLPENIRIHDLRHTFVSFMLSQNVPPKDVQAIAGHADFSTTMDIYGHLMPGAQKEAAKKMDKMFNRV